MAVRCAHDRKVMYFCLLALVVYLARSQDCDSDSCDTQAHEEDEEALWLNTQLLQLDVKIVKKGSSSDGSRQVTSAVPFAADHEHDALADHQVSRLSAGGGEVLPSANPLIAASLLSVAVNAHQEITEQPRVATSMADFAARIVASQDAERGELRRQEEEKVTWLTAQASKGLPSMPPGEAHSEPEIMDASPVAPAKPVEKAHDDGRMKMLEAAIPVGGILLGAPLYYLGLRTASMLSVYFGAQAGFSFYMKSVLSQAVISEELNIHGVPAGFLVTAIQQAVAFCLLASILAVVAVTTDWYTPRKLKTPGEWACVILFSFAFAANIGFNNFSLSLMAISINLILRGCVPLVTLVLQQLFGSCMGGVPQTRFLEVFLMVAGVFFAALATIATSHSHHQSTEGSHLVLGVLTCALSDVAAAMNLILMGAFGTIMDPPLNPLDTTFYMAIPCALFLLPCSFMMSHPVDWPGFGAMTDSQVLDKVAVLNPEILLYVVLSGGIAAAYNVLQYAVVQQLSPTHAAFAGNFNKAATIMLSICLGLESLPGGKWSTVMLLAIFGNIGAFTGFSMLKAWGNEKNDKGLASASKGLASESTAQSSSPQLKSA